MKRTKLSDRVLPCYSKGEEIMNMVTHIVGGGLGCIILITCILKAVMHGSDLDLVGVIIYGVSMVTLYTISSIYHGLHAGTAKKVLQIIDHCMIYFLIAGTYTPILLSGLIPAHPVIGWFLLCLQWVLGIIAAVLTAIDLKKFKIFSMICYIFMGWSIIFFLPQAWNALSKGGFLLILSGGIAYTIGAVLFGLGTKLRWMHAIFHIFVVIGSVLQYLGIIIYVI